ncbi:MAG: TetR/AcrR family transcriptional regulator [Actinomycetota bacterium]|nr:TetR/AcrR family transcriptional regulator [Actinomycetota bacterium]
MDGTDGTDTGAPGAADGWEAYLETLPLRERKKARTKLTIQDHAFRLFTERGYEATTVEEIAAAAEVGPRTVYRYFPTKDELVLWDVIDDTQLRTLVRARPGESPAATVMRSLGDVLAEIDSGARRSLLMRLRLMLDDPGLFAAASARMLREVDRISEAIAAECDGAADDVELRIVVGAVLGAWWQGGVEWARNGGEVEAGGRTSSAPFAFDVVGEILARGFGDLGGSGPAGSNAGSDAAGSNAGSDGPEASLDRDG